MKRSRTAQTRGPQGRRSRRLSDDSFVIPPISQVRVRGRGEEPASLQDPIAAGAEAFAPSRGGAAGATYERALLRRVSVVIPTRGRAASLARCLKSLAVQTGGAFEVIVVCDGEDAETRALSCFGSFGIPIRWLFLPENHGLAAARNIGA